MPAIDWRAIADPLCVLLMAGVIALALRLHRRRPRGLVVLLAIGTVAAGLRAFDLPVALLLLPAIGTAAALIGAWRDPATDQPTVPIAAALLPWSLALADSLGAVPAVAWIAAGLHLSGVFDRGVPSGTQTPRESLQIPHPVVRPLAVFAAMLMLFEARGWHATGAMPRTAIWWLGAVLAMDLRFGEHDRLDTPAGVRRAVGDRLGSVLLGGQTLLAALTATGSAEWQMPAARAAVFHPDAGFWVSTLASSAVLLFVIAVGYAVRFDRDPMRSLTGSLLASAAGLIVTAAAAMQTLPGGWNRPLDLRVPAAMTDTLARWRPDLTLALLAGGLAVGLIGLAGAARLLPADAGSGFDAGIGRRRRIALGLSLGLTLPVLPTGLAWWLAIARLTLLPLDSPLTGNPEPQPAAMLIGLLVLVGPLATVPAIVRMLWPPGERGAS